MTRRREVERHMRSLGEIREIMTSMKTLAFMETRKLAGRLENQQRAVGTIEQAAQDFLAFYPAALPSAQGLTPAYVVVGSERGFCGDFNEQVLKRLEARIEAGDDSTAALITVGQRLCARLADDPRVVATIEGPDVAEEVERVLVRIVDAVSSLRRKRGPLSLAAVFQRPEPSEVAAVSLIPPFRDCAGAGPRFRVAPLLNLPPSDFFLALVDNYLFATLHEVLNASLMAENHQRVRHLDGAVRHLDQRLEALRRKSDQLRQEEIIEEIEVILLGAADLQHVVCEEPHVRQRNGSDEADGSL
ncbi:MAG: F0F1 ATP synthase subunit gamma [Gammaproteobacteria bacterium]|nr:F0F1 ATP synthase subunit gamma [Gammaproteobacteria bacterium]